MLPLAVLIIGLITCIAARRRLKSATLPLAGLFVLAADSDLLRAKLSVFNIVERLGYTEVLRGSPLLTIWYYTWHLLPVLLAGFFAWMLVRAVRRNLPARRDAEPISPTRADG